MTHISLVARSGTALRVAIIIGNTRFGWNAETVARWVFELAKIHSDAEFEIVDLKDYGLPLTEPSAAAAGAKPHTTAWATKIASFNAFVIVTPAYNHRTSAALKNAIGQLHEEWRNKAVGFVSCGRWFKQLREIVRNADMADVPRAVGLSPFTDFEDFTTFKPGLRQEQALVDMLDQVVGWGNALKPLQMPSVQLLPTRRSRSRRAYPNATTDS